MGILKKIVRSINKIYFCGFIVLTLSVLLLGRNDIAKENIEISTEELKENINLN